MDEKLEWEIKTIQGRYRYLRLSAKQALAVYHLEQEWRPRDFDVDIFSFWEEQDYEWDRWRKILTDSQMKKFEERQAESVKREEKGLRASNEDAAKELALMQEWVGWLKEEFVPDLVRDAIKSGILFSVHWEKIQLLRREYKKYLERRRYSAIVKHYRYSRRLQPNTLELALLKVEEISVLPNYIFFIEQADEAVKAVATFLLKRFKGTIRSHTEFLKQKFAETGERWRILREKHFGDETKIAGWHFAIYPNHSLSDEEVAWMDYLLMDTPDPYSKRIIDML